MNIHFQDWSDPALLEQLVKKELPHAGKIIKVFATDENPRIVLGREALTVVTASGLPFTEEEEFEYPGRGTYSGPELEDTLQAYGIGEVGPRTLRALFRFSNQNGFCQGAMAANKTSGEPLIDHPFEEIDGITWAKRKPSRERALHLDIFFPESIDILRGVVNYNDPNAVLNMYDGTQYIMGL
jgi:hypothetical protein